MNQRDKIVEIAKSQIGYHEGYNNDTKYGDWYGLPNQPWCAMFVSWCAHESGIPESIIPKFAGCITGFNEMSKMGITTTEHITPEKGDLIFFEWDGEPGDIDHVGIVEYVENDLVHTIEGNHSDSVDQFVYYKDSDCIVGYAQPKYEDIPEPAPAPANEVVLDYQQSWNKTYGDIYGYIPENGVYSKETEWSKTKVFLEKGMSNHLVGWCQCRLRWHKGYYLGDTGINHDGVDDDFGSKTKEVVEQFRRDNGLEEGSTIEYSVISLLF